jgi:2'-5' RNA ligase
MRAVSAALRKGRGRARRRDDRARILVPRGGVRRVALLLLSPGGERWPRAIRGRETPVSGRPVRGFVAVLLPDGVRARLAATAAELRARAPGLAWVRADNLHLTLRFLGEVEPAALERVREAVEIAATAVPAFTVELGGLGGFPSGRAPRVVWAGVIAGGEGLGALHAALEAALITRGIPGEGRGFHPHVTLARARDPRGAGGLASALGAGPVFGEVRVTALHLMRSDLDSRGARYSILAEAPLDDASGGG